MTALEATIFVAAIWIAGGAFFVHAVLTNRAASPAVAANSRAILTDVTRLRPAALVALVLFLVVWPVIFVIATVTR